MRVSEVIRIVFPVQAPPLEARCCRHKVGGAGESVDHALATSIPGLLALSIQVEEWTANPVLYITGISGPLILPYGRAYS